MIVGKCRNQMFLCRLCCFRANVTKLEHLICREADKPPVSFVVVRVAAKSPCLVLRVAFLGGTIGSDRLEVSCNNQQITRRGVRSL